MERGLCLQTRRELLVQVLPHYRGASPAQKRQLLDAFTQRTGYHRKYAM
ncbi:ABC transporter substrate-binding protein [Reticulibacter mediterranei]|nr:ABC transporter substrate-binding protein [Reticulibacter mediterranei]